MRGGRRHGLHARRLSPHPGQRAASSMRRHQVCQSKNHVSLQIGSTPDSAARGHMARRPKQWIDSPPQPPKPKVPESVQRDVATRAHECVESVLKPKHLKPAPPHADWNYLVDIATKWYRNYFSFSATYCSPGPSALAPSVATPFARLESVGDQQFHLSHMRHTGQWWELYTALSVEACWQAISDEPHFMPSSRPPLKPGRRSPGGEQ